MPANRQANKQAPLILDVELAGSGVCVGKIQINIRESWNTLQRCQQLQKLLAVAVEKIFAQKPEPWTIRAWLGQGGVELTQRPLSNLTQHGKDICPGTTKAWHKLRALQVAGQASDSVCISVSTYDPVEQAAYLVNCCPHSITLPEYAEAKQIVLTNKNMLVTAIATAPMLFVEAAEAMQHDREVAQAAVASAAKMFSFLSADLRNDPDISLAAARQGRLFIEGRTFDEESLDIFTNTLTRVDEDLAASVLDVCPRMLSGVRQFQNNERLVKVAISSDAKVLEFASETLKNSEEIVFMAVCKDTYAFCFASAQLRDNGDFVLHLMKNVQATQRASAIMLAVSGRLAKDKNFVGKAINIDPACISYADVYDLELGLVALKRGVFCTAFDTDESYMRCAIEWDASKLEMASPKMRATRSIVEMAVTSNYKLLRYADQSLIDQMSLDVLKRVLTSTSTNDLQNENWWCSWSLGTRDRDVVFQMVQMEGLSIYVVGTYDQYFLDAAIEQNPKALSFCRYIRSDVMPSLGVVLKAVSQNGRMLQYVLTQQKTLQVVMAAVAQDGMALRFAWRWADDKQVVMAAVAQNGMALQLASAKWRDDPEVVLKSLDKSHLPFQFASTTLKRCTHFVAQVVARAGEQAFEFAYCSPSRVVPKQRCAE